MLVDDLGSGAAWPIEDEPTARSSIAAGAHVVAFSGDKLLGGPQAGILAGRADLIERLRRHPLQRALRPDKLAVAALDGTLAALRRARTRSPCCRWRGETSRPFAPAPSGSRRRRGGTVEETTARVGGGALPLAELPSFACALPVELAVPLRLGEPPVVGIIRDERLLLDCRTLTDRDAEEAAAAVAACRSR